MKQNKQTQSIVDKINAENEKKYGPKCNRCDMFEHWCRCNEHRKWMKENGKKN